MKDFRVRGIAFYKDKKYKVISFVIYPIGHQLYDTIRLEDKNQTDGYIEMLLLLCDTEEEHKIKLVQERLKQSGDN